jgi:hypothetical protein
MKPELPPRKPQRRVYPAERSIAGSRSLNCRWLFSKQSMSRGYRSLRP